MESTPSVAPNAVTGLAQNECVRAFDLAAGLAVFFMILVHILWHWGEPSTWTTPIGEAISFAAGPTAAPVFVFLMGASLGATKRTSFRSLAARGLWLVFLGYVLNFLRGVIPAALGLASGVITADQVAPYTLWWLGTTVDLHHMVGFSLVAIAALRTKVEPGWIWLALAGLLILIAPIARAVAVGSPILDAPLTPFVGSAPNVYYAVVPWLAYPLAGAVFGRLITQAADRTAVFRRGAMIGMGLIGVGLGLIYLQRPGFDVYTYWRQPLSFAVAIFGVILVWLALCDAVTRRPRIDRRLRVVYGWSDRVIAMYFSHWIIVGWGVGLVGFRALGLGPVLVAMAAAVVLTSYVSRFAVRLEANPWFQRRRVGSAASLEAELPAT